MNSEISDGLKDLIEGGATPITLAELELRAAARPASAHRHRSDARLGARLPRRPARLAVTGAASAALAAAVALTATSLTGSTVTPSAGPAAILTAAMVRHLASESRLALASAGRAEVTYRDTQAGVVQDYGSDDITFSGENWNDAFSQTLPAAAGQPAETEFAINRIVNGQAYYYIKGQTNKLEWYHDTNPSNHPQVSVPDPRTALAVLKPSARFEVVGYQTIGGIRLEELRATAVSQLPSLGNMPDIQPGEQITSLEVWVDRHGVVHRMSLGLQQTMIVYPLRGIAGKVRILSRGRVRAITLQKIEELLKNSRRHPAQSVGASSGRREVQVTQLTVSFLDIGQRELITVPAHSIPVYALG